MINPFILCHLKAGQPSTVTMVRSLSIIFSFMFEAVTSAVDPATKMPKIDNWFGAAIVFVAIMIVASADLRDKITRAFNCLLCCIKASDDDEVKAEKEEEPVTLKAKAGEGNVGNEGAEPQKEKEDVTQV